MTEDTEFTVKADTLLLMVLLKAFASSKNCYSKSVTDLRITNTFMLQNKIFDKFLHVYNQEPELRVAASKPSTSLTWHQVSRAPVGLHMNSRNENYEVGLLFPEEPSHLYIILDAFSSYRS